jgi:hypothetical protein
MKPIITDFQVTPEVHLISSEGKKSFVVISDLAESCLSFSQKSGVDFKT